MQAAGRLQNAEGDALEFSWNGVKLRGLAGDSLAAALYANGVRALTRSRKFHQPRGLSGTFPAGHLACVDGVPHVRLDRAYLRPGQDVRMQNVWPSATFDLLSFARLLPRKLLRSGFEHPRFIPDGSFAWAHWEKFLWRAAGEVDPPDAGDRSLVPGVKMKVDTLVVGGGSAGLEAAAAAEGTTLLVTRSRRLGGSGCEDQAKSTSLPGSVRVLTDHEVYALFDGARVATLAPNDPSEPAVLVEADKIVLATGAQSVPPLIGGATLPGVLDARAALHLVTRYRVALGRRTVVIGTPKGRAVAERLSRSGCEIVDFVDVAAVDRIDGRGAVEAITTGGRRIPCDCVVHAGPWRPDPSLVFQAGADGDLRLLYGELPSNVSLAGACAGTPEPIALGPALDGNALVCPCMDVTVSEVLDLIGSGVTHVEELKRRSTCGMGTCQGVPCWDYLASVTAQATRQPLDTVGHPTYRPPRGAVTLGQVAGLAELTEVER